MRVIGNVKPKGIMKVKNSIADLRTHVGRQARRGSLRQGNRLGVAKGDLALSGARGRHDPASKVRRCAIDAAPPQISSRHGTGAP